MAKNRITRGQGMVGTLSADGATGATAHSRYAGATASGAPLSGTFQLGDFVIDQSGAVWVCSVAGSPGTWVASASGTNATFSQHNTVARTDTSAKNLFTLPANAVITGLRVYTAVASDAGSTAVLSVGKSGSATAYLNALDVKGGGVGVLAAGAKTTLGGIGASPVVVQGIYAETGGASTTGGPFLVVVDYTAS